MRTGIAVTYRSNASSPETAAQGGNTATRGQWLSVLWIVGLLTVCCRGANAQPPAAESLPAATAASSAPVVLHLRGEVALESPIIRLEDIAVPVGRAPQNWPRVATATVALLPADGRRLRIERQRLSELLQQSKLIDEGVRWSGPETISVRYVAPSPSPAGQDQPALPLEDAAAATQPVSFTTDSRPASPADSGSRMPDAAVSPALAALPNRPQPTHPPLPPAERNRIRRMIAAAFERTHEDLYRRYALTIDQDQNNLGALDGLRAIRNVRLSGEPGQGEILLVVSGDTELERVEAPVRVVLDELPLAVVTTRALRRGDLVSARDLRLEPVPRERYEETLFSKVEAVVGMEVKRPLSVGRLVAFADVMQPIVIDRGDLVDVRVVAGGVTVTTAARALGPAAAGEPVSVETQSPRRRLMGRAVAAGIVEIVTRPPTTAVAGESP